MQIELIGGPADGSRAEVPDDTQLWVLSQPPMTAEQFVAAQDRPDLIQFATRQPREHAYEKTQRRAYSGCWIFIYTGERAVK